MHGRSLYTRWGSQRCKAAACAAQERLRTSSSSSSSSHVEGHLAYCSLQGPAVLVKVIVVCITLRLVQLSSCSKCSPIKL